MLLGLLASNLTNLIQGVKYDVSFPVEAVENFEFTVKYEEAPAYFEISDVAEGSVFIIKICENENCYAPYHVEVSVKKPHVFIFSEAKPGKDYILEFGRNSETASASVLFEEYKAIGDHEAMTLVLENGSMEFLYINCHNDDSPAELTTKDGALMYLSTGSGYADDKNCTGHCGLAEATVSNFRFIRGTIISQGESAVLQVKESQFTPVVFNGSAEKLALPKSLICAGFYQMDINALFVEDSIRPGVETVSIMAYHELPALEGDLRLQVSTNEDFTGAISSKEGFVTYGLEELEELEEERILYIKVNQNKYLEPTDLYEVTDVMISGAPNIIVAAPREQLSHELTPFYREDGLAQKALGSRYFFYSFLRSELNTEVKLNGVIEAYELFYTVKMVTDTANSDHVDCNMFIDYDSIANATNNIPISEEIRENDKIGVFAIEEANSSEPSDQNFAYGQSIFSTGTVQKDQQDLKVPDVNAMFEADLIVQVNLHETVYEKQQNGVFRYYFMIPRTSEAAAEGGAVLVAELKYCMPGEHTYNVYSSVFNPLPNDEQHQRYYGNFSEPTAINIPYTNLVDAQYDFISIVKDTDMCALALATYQHGDNLEKILEGNSITKSFDKEESMQFVVILDGFSYSKENGWVKLQVVENESSEIELDIGISESEIFATEGETQNYVYKASMPGDYSMHEFNFELKGVKRFYLTVNRTSLNELEDDTPIKVIIQAGSYVQLEEELRQIVPLPEAAYPGLLQYRIRSSDNIYFEATRPESIEMFHCASVIPILSEIGEICSTMLKNEKGQYFLASSDNIYSAGVGYIALKPVNGAVGNIQIMTYISTEIVAGRVVDVKTNGNPSFVTIKMPRRTEEGDYGVSEAISCENCILCLSFSDETPYYNISNPNASTCDVIIGRMLQDDEEYGHDDDDRKEFKATVSIAMPSGIDQIYGEIVPLGSLGLVDKMRFRISLQKALLPNTEALANIGYTEGIEGEPEGASFYPEINYRIPIEKEILQADTPISLTVAPELNENQTLAEYETHHFSVYASAKHQIPTPSKYEWASDKDHGVATIALDESAVKEILEGSCVDESGVCFLYVSILATRDSGPEYSLIESFLATEPTDSDATNVVNAAAFGRINTVEGLRSNWRKLYHFNILASPMTFVVSPCQSNPQLRAGKTDYFRRSFGHDPEIEASEGVYYSEGTNFGSDIYFVVTDGGAYKGNADWFFEIAAPEGERIDATVSAEFLIGNSDPRPGTPIRLVEIGSKGGKLEARFHQAISSNENDSLANIEYNIFLMAKRQQLETEAYNQNTACGFLEGGIPLLKKWIAFETFADKELLTSDVDFQEFVTDSGTDDFYITVVAKQADLQIMRSYAPQLINMAALPGVLKVVRMLTELEIIIIVAFCIAIVLLLSALGFYLWKRYRVSHAVLAQE